MQSYAGVQIENRHRRCYSKWNRDRNAYESGPSHFSPLVPPNHFQESSQGRGSLSNKSQKAESLREVNTFDYIKSVSVFFFSTKAP